MIVRAGRKGGTVQAGASRPGMHSLVIPRRPLAALALALLVAVAGLTAQQPPLAAQALTLGDENSWVRIQNVGAKPATVDLTFFDGAGAKVASDGCPKAGQCATIAPGVGWSFFQQGFSG